MQRDDNVIRAGGWPRPRTQVTSEDTAMQNDATQPSPIVREAPISAAQALAEEAASTAYNPGSAPHPAYEGAFGRTLFDDRASEDGTVTVVFPPDQIGDIPSQSLVRIVSLPDEIEYVASVTSGPFCEPDGLAAQSPQLVVAAVRGFNTLPRHHGRLQATILGERTAKGVVPARRRPRPNSAVHVVPDNDVADILNIDGDMRLGLLVGHDDVQLRVDSKKKSILPRHTAHIGTTGGGKSTGVGRNIHELQKADTCVVAFDVEGEYTALNEPTDNDGLIEVLEQRGMEAEGVKKVHVYTLYGFNGSNPKIKPRQFTLRFDQISPFAFGEIMDLTDPQAERLFQAYEIARSLMRDLGIFPEKDNDEHQKMLIEIDEFERGWPKLKLEDLRYVVGGVIAISNKSSDEEPPYRQSQFFGNWGDAKKKIQAYFGGGDDDKKKLSISSPTSWKALMSKLSRLQRLKVFDRGLEHAIDYKEMLQPGRINIIDLSEIENMDVRNLSIAEMLRGILDRQQEIYDEAVAAKGENDELKPLMTNVIIEEAHEFLSARRVTKMPTLRDQLMKIAKRGRKRYLGLTFVTQSPNDLPDDVLGLVNNWIVYKIDEATIRRLKSYIPNTDDSLWNLVRGLGPGQALASFTHMRRPVIAAIDPSPARLLMAD